jgi:hypothetical protein
MKLRALDQVSISAVQADSIRKGQVFEVSDAYGEELLKKLPNTVERIGAAKAAPKPRNMAARAPRNKAAPRPRNKAAKPASPAS